jgi:hypothetical protein
MKASQCENKLQGWPAVILTIIVMLLMSYGWHVLLGDGFSAMEKRLSEPPPSVEWNFGPMPQF